MKLGKRTERRYTEQDKIKKSHGRDFPGGPMVKILYSNARGTSSIPGWGLRPQVPLGTAKRKRKKRKAGREWA